MARAWLELLAFVAQATGSVVDEECAAIPNVMLRAMIESIQRHCRDISDDAMLGVFDAWINRHFSWSNRRATSDGLFAAAVIAPLVGRGRAVLELGNASGDMAQVLGEMTPERRNSFFFESRKSAWFGMVRALAHGYEVVSAVGRAEARIAVTSLDLRKKKLRLTPQQTFSMVSRNLAASRSGLFCLILAPIQAQLLSRLDGTWAIAQDSLRAVIRIPGTKGHLLYLFAPHAFAKNPGTVLIIDGSAVSRLVVSDRSVEAAFYTGMIAGIYLVEALYPPGLGYEPIVRGKFMRGILGDLLDGEFRELEGICRIAPIERLFSVNEGDISPLLSEGPPTERFVDARVRTLLDITKQGSGSSCQYVIGNNGVGKSFLLKTVADELVSGGSDVLALAFTSPDRFAKSESERYRYRGLQADFADKGVMTLDERLFATAISIHRSPERSDVFYEMLSLLGFRAECVAMASGDEGEGIDVASSVVNLVEAARGGGTSLSSMSFDGMTLGLSRSNDDQFIVPYAELSSGERQIVRLAAALAGEVLPGTIVLVDEPEVSLHVAWQALLPRVFACLQAAIPCHVMVATHSALVISTVGDGATCYSLSPDGMAEIPRNELRSVESALFDGFSTYTPRNRAVHEECAHLVSEAIRLASNASEGRLAEFVSEAVDRLGVAAMTVDRGAPMAPDSASKDAALIFRTVAALHEIMALDEKQVIVS